MYVHIHILILFSFGYQMFSQLGLIKSLYSFTATFYVGPILRYYFMLFNSNPTFFNYLVVKVPNRQYRLN